MKLFLLTVLLGTSFIFSSCKKSNNTTNARPILNAMQGTWTLTSARCYQDQSIILPHTSPPYFTFNTDMSVNFSSPGSVSFPTTYDLLADDSTIIMQINSLGPARDTFVIVSITPTEFIYHGKNTYLHSWGPSACVNGNVLDSLYR